MSWQRCLPDLLCKLFNKAELTIEVQRCPLFDNIRDDLAVDGALRHAASEVAGALERDGATQDEIYQWLSGRRPKQEDEIKQCLPPADLAGGPVSSDSPDEPPPPEPVRTVGTIEIYAGSEAALTRLKYVQGELEAFGYDARCHRKVPEEPADCSLVVLGFGDLAGIVGLRERVGTVRKHGGTVLTVLVDRSVPDIHVARMVETIPTPSPLAALDGPPAEAAMNHLIRRLCELAGAMP